jgi:hypothetical protein
MTPHPGPARSRLLEAARLALFLLVLGLLWLFAWRGCMSRRGPELGRSQPETAPLDRSLQGPPRFLVQPGQGHLL